MSNPSTWIEAIKWGKSETAAKVEFFRDHCHLWELTSTGVILPRKTYRCDHDGTLGSNQDVIQRATKGETPRRSEPWFARAIFNDCRSPRRTGGSLTGTLPWEEIVDYETPLKAPGGQGRCQGVGKIDLLARGLRDECVVVELKIRPSETLLKALVELGTYGTILRDEKVRMQLLDDFDLDNEQPCKFVVLGQSGFFQRPLYPQLSEAACALSRVLCSEVAFVEMTTLTPDIVQHGHWLDRAALKGSKPYLAGSMQLAFNLVATWQGK